MGERVRQAWGLIRDAGAAFWRDRGPRLGAALAFYTALSLSPLLVVVVGIAGMVFGEQAASGQLAEQIRELVGEEGAKVVQTMLANHTKESGLVATIVGLVTLFVGSTGVFAELQDSLDTIWGAQPPPSSGLGIKALLKDRLLSFSMVCGLAFLLLVSLVVSAVLSGLNGVLNRWFPGAEQVLGLGNLLISFLLTGVMFALIFKVLPHARPTWRDVWVGAGITAVLFAVGKLLIGLYLGKAAVGSAYGAAGSFVVLLVWVYYSTQILVFGAEVTQIYAARFGSGWKTAKQRADHTAPDRPADRVVPATA
jgi:membrane protein